MDSRLLIALLLLVSFSYARPSPAPQYENLFSKGECFWQYGLTMADNIEDVFYGESPCDPELAPFDSEEIETLRVDITAYFFDMLDGMLSQDPVAMMEGFRNMILSFVEINRHHALGLAISNQDGCFTYTEASLMLSSERSGFYSCLQGGESN